jgi:hypothetical protein
LLPDFQVSEEPPNVRKQEVADLGLVLERGLDLGKGVFQIPVLVGKERGPRLAAFFPSPKNR